MITHIVIFWVDKPIDENRERLLEEARSLASIPGVKNYRAGVPVPSARAVVDESFAVGISMDFEDAAALEAYQKHPDHQAFVQNVVKPLVGRFVVYDLES